MSKVPKALQKLVDASVQKAVAADRALRTQTAPADVSGKGAAGKIDMRTAIGLRLKSLYMNHPLLGIQASDSEKAWVKKSASAYEGVYGQGGSLLREEYSSEIIEFLRPATALLRAGARTQTYVGRLTIGRLNGGAVAQFVSEAQAPTVSEVKTSAVVLGSHKLMGLYEPSNDLLRNPDIDSAGILSDDLFAAMGVASDQAGLLGDGTGPNPLGLLHQVKTANKVDGVAITNANRNNVIRFLDSFEHRVKSSNLSLEGNKPFWTFSSGVEMALKGLTAEITWLEAESHRL
ncbi:phage major capsid protein [Archangium primigenium]|uniref:phage major capsid protein n=1 Tax=[Archangium] primigenium TaxID=2792470 RepID=UPI00195A941B|nr:phage major capsid protein [Archangium primigenium]MBM7117629.1 phage major capsid protein [Archangium primigenium]